MVCFGHAYLSDGSDGEESACNAGDLGSIPGLGRSPGGRHGNLFQYSCLGNLMGRGAWQATIHGVANSQTRLSDEHSLVFLLTVGSFTFSPQFIE